MIRSTQGGTGVLVSKAVACRVLLVAKDARPRICALRLIIAKPKSEILSPNYFSGQWLRIPRSAKVLIICTPPPPGTHTKKKGTPQYFFTGALGLTGLKGLNPARTKASGLNGGFPKLGVLFGGPNNKDYSILGSILGSPHFGKLPNTLNPKPWQPKQPELEPSTIM